MSVSYLNKLTTFSSLNGCPVTFWNKVKEVIIKFRKLTRLEPYDTSLESWIYALASSVAKLTSFLIKSAASKSPSWFLCSLRWGVHLWLSDDGKQIYSRLPYQLKDGRVHLTGFRFVSVFIFLPDAVHLLTFALHSLLWCFTIKKDVPSQQTKVQRTASNYLIGFNTLMDNFKFLLIFLKTNVTYVKKIWIDYFVELQTFATSILKIHSD